MTAVSLPSPVTDRFSVVSSAAAAPSSADVRAERELGRVTGRLATDRRAVLRTAVWGLALVAPAATLFSVGGAPTALLVLAVAAAAMGLLFLVAVVVELLPAPAALVFYEQGFAEHGADGSVTTFAYDGWGGDCVSR